MSEKRKKALQVDLKRLAESRIPKAVRSISLVGNLANYKPTPEQARMMITAIYAAAEQMKAQLQTGKREVGFRLM